MYPSRNAAETALSSGEPSPFRSIVASSAYSDSLPIAVLSSTRAWGITSSGPTTTTERSSGRPPLSARTSSTSELTAVTTSFASSGEQGSWSQALNAGVVATSGLFCTGTRTPSVSSATACSRSRADWVAAAPSRAAIRPGSTR